MGELEIRSGADESPREPGFLNLTGREIGRYRIQQRLGRGGVTTVYQAYDTVAGFAVALKILLHGNDEKLYNRFRHEAQTAARLIHPNIVRTLRVGVTPGTDTAYIAMELVEGEDLAAMLAVRRRLSPEDSCRLLEPVARALAYAHNQGVIHRDVKPSNILLRSVGADEPNNVVLDALDYPIVPLLSDFGIARALDAPELTNAGRTVGTPAFMAPEQARGQRDIDHRADLYALGAVFYRCITGRQPFIGTTVQILHAHVYEPLTINEEIGRQLSPRHIQILQRTLAKDPADRYQSAEELAQDLARGINPAQDQMTASAREGDSTLTLELAPTTEQPAPSGTSQLLIPAVPTPLATIAAGTAQSTLSPPATQTLPALAYPADPHFDQLLDNRLQRVASTLLSLLLTLITLVVIWLLWGTLIFDALQRYWNPAALIEPTQVIASTIPPTPVQTMVVLPQFPAADVAPPVVNLPAFNPIRGRSLNRDTLVGAALQMPPAPVPTLPSRPRPTTSNTPPLGQMPVITRTAGNSANQSPTALPTTTVTCTTRIDTRLQPFLNTLTPDLRADFQCPLALAETMSGEYLRYENGYMLYLPTLKLILIGYDQARDAAQERNTLAWEIVDLTLQRTRPQPQPTGDLTLPEDQLFPPKGAFAEAWQRVGVKQLLGLARTPGALAFDLLLQKFSGGWLLLDHHALIAEQAPLHVFATSARLF